MSANLTNSFFTSNRDKLKSLLGDGPPIVIVAHGLMQRSNDTEYRFEQDRNFYYLSGLDEPDWILIIDGSDEYLIEPEMSEVEVIFNGAPDLDNVCQMTGVQNIISTKEGWEKLKKYREIRTPKADREKIGPIFTNPSKRLFAEKLKIKSQNITPQLLHLRTIKSELEVKVIREAINITAGGFLAASKVLDTVKTEAELEAVFTGHFIANESQHGYTPIVAGGANACTLHYTENNQKLSSNGLVLIDIGAQYHYYSADVTRTLSKGKLTDRQTEVKQAVSVAFGEIISVIKPGLKFEKYQEKVNDIMSDAVTLLGLGDAPKDREKYFPHAPSHGLGLDVHDSLIGFDSFQPGMIVTLEPGIYIPEEAIGVRHEDDLLITSGGVENLSQMIGD